MDIKTLSDGQRYTLQQLLEKLLSRNKFAPNEVESFQKLVKNVRDSKNFKKIMEKFKIGQFDSEIIADNFKEGLYFVHNKMYNAQTMQSSILNGSDGSCIMKLCFALWTLRNCFAL